MTPDSGIALLLAEDFDGGTSKPVPDIEALLAAARAEARAELAAAFDARAAAAQEALASGCTALAASLVPALAALDEAVAEVAQSLARAMIAAIGAALPAWSETPAPQINAGIVAVLSRVLGEAVSLRLVVPAADAATLRPLLPPNIAIETDPAMAQGALRLTWGDGQATREPASIWREIETIMALALGAPARAVE